jgi:hypothetical protein
LGWPSNGGGGGTAVPSLSGGLDYAFILLPGCGACYPLARILVRAPRLPAQRVYESLQGRPEVGPLPTPRRCHAAFSGGNRVRRCEPRFHFALSDKGNLTDRTRVRKPYTVRTTCLAWSFEFRLEPADRQAGSRLATSTDPPGEGATPGREADVNDAALPGKLGLRLPHRGSLAHQQTSAASSRY